MVSLCLPDQTHVRIAGFPRRCYSERRRGQMVRIPYFFSSPGFCYSQTHTKDGIGSQIGLIGAVVKFVEESIYCSLILDIKTLLDEGGANYIIDIFHGFVDSFALPVRLIPITQFMRFMLTCRSALEGVRGVGQSRERRRRQVNGKLG